MSEYLFIAMGFYLGASAVNLRSFADQDWRSYLRGVMACLIWPLFWLFQLGVYISERKAKP